MFVSANYFVIPRRRVNNFSLNRERKCIASYGSQTGNSSRLWWSAPTLALSITSKLLRTDAKPNVAFAIVTCQNQALLRQESFLATTTTQAFFRNDNKVAFNSTSGPSLRASAASRVCQNGRRNSNKQKEWR